MTRVVFALLFAATLAPSSARSFTGTITDSVCDRGDHAAMRMGPTDAECATACAEEHDAALVLYDGTNVYALSDQPAARKFVARKVTVVGALDAKTKKITVTSIVAAK
jgi:hypothetical protein